MVCWNDKLRRGFKDVQKNDYSNISDKAARLAALYRWSDGLTADRFDIARFLERVKLENLGHIAGSRQGVESSIAAAKIALAEDPDGLRQLLTEVVVYAATRDAAGDVAEAKAKIMRHPAYFRAVVDEYAHVTGNASHYCG